MQSRREERGPGRRRGQRQWQRLVEALDEFALLFRFGVLVLVLVLVAVRIHLLGHCAATRQLLALSDLHRGLELRSNGWWE